jgi:hypothetical protein
MYYFNPRTGRATWEKPRLLRRPSDIKVPIYLPEPDRGLIVPCSVCVGENKVARHFCVECAEFYCAADFDKSHRKGAVTFLEFAWWGRGLELYGGLRLTLSWGQIISLIKIDDHIYIHMTISIYI